MKTYQLFSKYGKNLLNHLSDVAFVSTHFQSDSVYILTIFLWSSSVKEVLLKTMTTLQPLLLIHVWTVTGCRQVNNQEQKQSYTIDVIITVDMQRDTFLFYSGVLLVWHTHQKHECKDTLFWNSEWCNCASEWDNGMMLTLKIIALFTLFFVSIFKERMQKPLSHFKGSEVSL